MPTAVVTFDEPEFEPSYSGTRNEGKSAFAWLFFTGRCRLSDIRLSLLKHGFVRGGFYLLCGVYYALRSNIVSTETIYQALEKEGVKATFFGIFSLLEDPSARDSYLSTFRGIVANGHELGLHGYHHGPLTELDLDRSCALARAYLGVELRIYSSPFGDDRQETLKMLDERGFLGMRVWDRSLLSRSSRICIFPYEHDLDKIATSNDPVVVMNFHSGDCYPWGLRRVKRTLADLRRRGYIFMTFGELCTSRMEALKADD